jgi:hypothetical protein
MCGGSFGTGSASERGILYSCKFPQPGQFSVCSFVQECSFGCQTQSAPNLNRNDVCATAPPFPVAVNPELVEGGRPSNGAVFLSAPAASLTSAHVNSSPVGLISPLGGFDIPQGATTAPFDVDTLGVAVPAFVQVRADLFLNPQQRYAQDYLAVVPVAGSRPPSGPLAVFDVSLTPMAVVQGNPSIGTVILNGVAPSGGAVASLFSDNSAALPPASVTVPAGQTAAVFGVTTSQVAAPALVTIGATFGGPFRSTTITVSPFIAPTTPPALSDLSLNPSAVVGGTRSTGRVTLTTSAPDPSAGVVSVALTSDNTAVAVVPKTVTVGHGGIIADFPVTTFAVTASTLVIITATYNGVTRSATLTVNPSTPGPPTPAAPTLVSPADAATGVAQPVTLDWNDVANATSYEVQVDNSSTIAAPFTANPTVTASQATLSGLPAQQLWWRVRAQNSAGVFGPFSATRSFTPQAAPSAATLSSVAVSPSSVVGGNGSTGTVTLTSAAPSGGALVSLSSSNTAAATVPASVTVAAGATSATFTVTTTTVSASTAVTISATYNGVTQTAGLTVTPPSQAVTLTVTATGRSGERVTSSPAGINVTVGTTGSASFNTGTSITLSVTNGRDAIWSGACSSGGNKTKTCTFTLNANATVTANVQ